jgi:hypothetical protein
MNDTEWSIEFELLTGLDLYQTSCDGVGDVRLVLL